ncbi:MAG: zinc-binding dehydrogenase [Acidilobaceae archaeon]|nr:zinc-binding dehydrogenase [Acidilobaceae archaeon]MCX8165718.1 zinc-binding dehydrogenase [Acidilobaceae archaeon]MDW7974143.1 zinc-binding dehydrogenase [Sulfolobales archaeon]
MRAILLIGIGGVDVLKEGEVDYPKVERDHIVLKVRGCGVCYRDTLVRRGFMRARIPVIPGHEVVGEVVEVGEGVEDLRKGELVASLIYVHDPHNPECRGEENTCRGNKWIGEDIDGCYAEYVKLPRWSLVKVGEPGESPPEAFSYSACVVGTAIRALKTLGKAKKGESVVITGASGGVGIHALQVAKSLGLRTIAVTRSEEKARIIESLGAEVVVYKDKFSDEVRKRTDGRGADIVLDTVGGPTLDQSLRSAARGGRVVLVGNVDPSPQPVMLGLIILRELRLHGALNSTPPELAEAVEMLKKGYVRPVFKTIPLEEEEVRRAHMTLERGGSLGRIVIRP